MAGSNNSLVFDQNFSNVQTDAEYSADTQRQGGVTPGIAVAKLHNKLYRQTSIMVSAIGELVKNQGYAASDTDFNALVQALTGAILTPGYTDFVSRQAIINGDFDIWQRGITFAGGGYTADRWFVNAYGSADVVASRVAFAAGQTEVPNNPKYFIRVQNNNVSATKLIDIIQRIENCNLYSGGKLSLSFWARVSSGTLAFASLLQQIFGTGGSSAVNVYYATLGNLTTTWQKFTLTVDVPSIAGKTVGTNDYFSADFLQATLPIGAYVDFAQVQMNYGGILLPFMAKSFMAELQDCLRYYEKSYAYSAAPYTTGAVENHTVINVGGNTVGNSVPYGVVPFKVTKRVAPTVDVVCLTNPVAGMQAVSRYSDGASLGNGSGVPYMVGMDRFAVRNTIGAITTDYGAVTFHFVADAEL